MSRHEHADMSVLACRHAQARGTRLEQTRAAGGDTSHETCARHLTPIALHQDAMALDEQGKLEQLDALIVANRQEPKDASPAMPPCHHARSCSAARSCL